MPLSLLFCCETLGLEESFQGYCFGHAFSKACQYAIIEDKVCKNVKEMFITFILIKFGEMHNLAKEI
jgi:hypothetical protein